MSEHTPAQQLSHSKTNELVRPIEKKSNRPWIQNLVDKTKERLKEKFKSISPKDLPQAARDDVAVRLMLQRTKDQLIQSKTESETDPLTGLFNRNGFEKAIEKKVNQLARTGSLVLVYFDANNLKQINDTQGHAAGDEYLKKIGRVLENASRGSDVISHIKNVTPREDYEKSNSKPQTNVARWGGDEFGVLLDTDEEGMETWITNTTADFNNEGITIGAGYSIITYDEIKGKSNEEREKIISNKKDEADQALYVAKKESKESKDQSKVFILSAKKAEEIRARRNNVSNVL